MVLVQLSGCFFTNFAGRTIVLYFQAITTAYLT